VKQSHRRSTWKMWVGEVLMTKRQFRRWLPGFQGAPCDITGLNGDLPF
jgi:hypothetical protein